MCTDRIYRFQMHDYAFSSNERLLHALGGDDFTRLLNQTIDEAMQQAGFSQKFINQVVCPAMRVNYGQGVTIPGFVGECLEVAFHPGRGRMGWKRTEKVLWATLPWIVCSFVQQSCVL